MNFTDEKDYIMRMIKEMVRVLFSLALVYMIDCFSYVQRKEFI